MNTNVSRYQPVPRGEDKRTRWARRRDIPFAILGWIGVVAVVLWGAGHIVRSILLLVIAALLAYALAPAVRFLCRFMPRFLAVLIVYLVVFVGLGIILYLITSTAVRQTIEFARAIPHYVTPGSYGSPSPLEQTLSPFGITATQIDAARQQIVSRIEGAAGSVIPILRSIFNAVLDTILIAVISIYMMLDGERIARWLRRNAPEPLRINFLLDTLQRVVGGYIRGQLLLSALIGILVWIGMTLFQLPYAVFLGVLAFIMAFIPIIGTFISGAVCVLVALTHGWPIALGVLAYFIGIHIFEGDVVGPRIVGEAVGLHPIVSLFALTAGAELFGIWGALFASPVAGVIQALIVAYWKEWRKTHPEQFVHTEEQTADAATHLVETASEQKHSPSDPMQT
ncbi:MAG TPA: AI-2E family transporter [Ktedonobacter sp.]|nr:AI-2E family transporter [Ktedonobacter sp.]